MEIIFRGLGEDATKNRCTDAEVVNLWHAFATALVPFARANAGKTHCEKAYYNNLVGFEGAEENGIEEFELTIEKTGSDEEFDHFSGQFVCDGKNLKALAKIKKDHIQM